MTIKKSIPKILIYPLFIMCLGVSYLIIPSSERGFFQQILIWLISILEVIAVILVVFSILKTIIHYRRNRKGKKSDFIKTVRKALEPKLGSGFVLGAILTELSVFYYSILGPFKKPTVIENEKVYTYHKTSQLKTIVIIFSILITMEGVFFHILIQLWSNVAAWVFTILNIYALLYLIGLYHSVRFLPHMIDFDKVMIRFGFQSSIVLDINNIDNIKPAKGSGGFGEKTPKETYYAKLNMDPPQFEIFLKEPALMKGLYGRKKYVKTVVFRTDEAMKMVKEITNFQSLHKVE